MPKMQHQFVGEFREGMPFLGGFLWIDFVNTTPVINGAIRAWRCGPYSVQNRRLSNGRGKPISRWMKVRPSIRLQR